MAGYCKFQNDHRKYENSQDMTKKSSKTLKKIQTTEEVEDNIIEWVTFYRRNINKFVEHYLGLNMHLYQALLLYLMNVAPMVVIVACRAAAKSFIIAVFACARCILYPGSRVVVASATKKQAKLIVTEKIQKELMPNSIALERAIKNITKNNNDIEVLFHNGSSIVVVPASETSRGYRGTVMIYEEFRMIKKDIIDSVLSPFLYVRQTPYLQSQEYIEHMDVLQEEPVEIYISSSWFKQHWMWDHMKLSTVEMYNKFSSVIIGFDYSITLKHGIRTRKQLIKERKKLGRTSFSIEYENLMLGETENAYYTFDMISKNRKIKKSFYPRKHEEVLLKKKNKFSISKQSGEIRIISMDIAMIEGGDNTAFTCIRGIPNRDFYDRKVSYIETMNGIVASTQAIRAKQLFNDFEADYFVIDAQNAGITVFDELGKVLYDDDRDIEYEPWTCFNDDATAKRIRYDNAKPIVFVIKASATFNHQMHMYMKNTLESRRIEFLIGSMEAEDHFEKIIKKKMSADEEVDMKLPYIQTDLLLNEMVNLTNEKSKNTGLIRLIEPRNGRKDRYSSLAMGNYFIQMLEQDVLAKSNKKIDWSDYILY